MRRFIWIKIALTLFILVATSAGGIWFGNAITPDVSTAARRTKWTSLGKPPEAAVKIAGECLCDRSYGVVVQSASGVTYIACPSGWQQWNNAYGTPWQLTACLGNPPTQECPGFESLPHPVKDCGLKYTSEWTLVQAVYTILEDGSVWQWNFTYGIGTIMGYWMGGCFWGLVVGIRIQDIVHLLGSIFVCSTQSVFNTSCTYLGRPDHRANCLGTGNTGSFNKKVSSLS